MDLRTTIHINLNMLMSEEDFAPIPPVDNEFVPVEYRVRTHIVGATFQRAKPDEFALGATYPYYIEVSPHGWLILYLRAGWEVRSDITMAMLPSLTPRRELTPDCILMIINAEGVGQVDIPWDEHVPDDLPIIPARNFTAWIQKFIDAFLHIPRHQRLAGYALQISGDDHMLPQWWKTLSEKDDVHRYNATVDKVRKHPWEVSI